MKKTIIIILVLIVIGVAFYFGYNRSQNKGTVELRTATIQPIHLEYKPAPLGNSGFTVSDSNAQLTMKGTISIGTLIDNLFLNDRILNWNSYYLEVNPEVGKRRYQINLSFPTSESTMNIIDSLGKEMGYTTQISETTLQFYRAVKTDKPILFPKSTSHNAGCQYSPNSLCRFTGFNFDNIFRQYKSRGIFIEDATGITDKFDGELLLDKNNPDAMKTELQAKAGIDLIPFEKTIKLIQVY